MRTRLIVAGFATVAALAVAVVAAQNPAKGQAAPAKKAATPTPAACGDPPADMKNVARDSRCFEMRTYVVTPEGPGSPDLINQRFREHTVAFFRKHGMTIVGFWIPVDKPDTIVYILAYPDAAARDAAWAAFNADAEWQRVRAEMNVRLSVTNQFMNATDYSPMK